MSNFIGNLFASVAKALGNVADIEAVALNDLGLVENGVASYESGQAVVLGTMSESGKPGKIIAVLDGGEAALKLGLS